MKNVNELDDFLRQKEEEFNIPYKEEYWEKASAFLDAERGAATGRWSVASLALLSSAVILSIALVGYFVFHTNSNTKTETTVSATVNSSTVKTDKSASVNNENSNATVNSSSANTANNNSSVNAGNVTNSTATSGAIANTNASTNNTNASGTNSNKSRSSVSALALTSATNTNSAPGKSVNPISGIYVTPQVVSGGVENSGNTNEIQNTEMNPVDAQRSLYINNPVESQIPEFANMTINDKTIAALYGLLYKSGPNNPYTKSHEVPHPAMFPQLGMALTGGGNIFVSFRDNNNQSYVSTNPFIGAKAMYQWCPDWLVQAQLNVLMRGGVNQQIPEAEGTAIDPVIVKYNVRNLYYIQLPVMLGYQISKGNTISAGLGVNYLVADGGKDSIGMTEGSYKLQNGKDFNMLDYFATIGYTYRLNRKLSFSLTADYGFTDVTEDSKNNHNINLGLSVNYSLFQKKAGN